MQAPNDLVSPTDSLLEKLQRHLSWLRRDPANPTLYRQCADLATQLRRHDLLLESAELALAMRAEDSALRFDRANAYIGLGNYRAALAALAEVPAATSDQQNAITANLGLCHYCLGEFSEALPHLMSEYQRGERKAALLFMLVRSHHYLGQMDEGAALAKQNPEPATHDASLAGAYALLFMDAEDAGSAARWAATALRLDPRSIDGGITEATLAILRLQTARAEQLFNNVLEVAPDAPRAWIGLGTLAMLQQELVRAESHFERGLQTMPQFIGGWHMLGWSQLMQQKLQAAEKSFQQAMELDRNFAETHGALATLDAMRGDAASAQQRLNVALRLDPQCASAQLAAALLEDRTLQGARSRDIIQKTLLGIGDRNSSALSRLLMKHTKH